MIAHIKSNNALIIGFRKLVENLDASESEKISPYM